MTDVPAPGVSGSGVPGPAVSVRRAVAADVEPLADVHIRCWQETYRGMLSDAFLAAADKEGRLALWRHLLDRPEPAEAWVACDGDTVVGFAGTRSVPAPDSPEGHPPPRSGPLELWGLYLLASRQGLGLGRQLISTALGTRAASLWVAAGNSRAIGFYRRFGFEPDGVEDTLADWEDLPEIRMVRPVQPAA
ncbi:GCN5-related N-acetyltransferase [Pseudarthrobacter chlorophenolicus A6]|uniref:GCN5-related N-acetyltransferase n=1 Tax=Pseudarthrobacter chlorophenolicus (strain ATCC 700700 / DSM 12829 / CIP 107037 / JCM 12360 / KCTC 9906 / NCIMB 13794 / A6) TaxID=452863 RepID=B8HCN3_PSECP|nr:GNAT family N-acetyltransferase [Pseudarthrobacter chlorophenolicus]ACL38816.1 GCN5-related N-acetyltransferase [Pseudarthrobacter chlorophenolicus A6]SDR08366.1 Ribosomal protein S18 acetylase RimI [Pseudarthrobacter chlorophenolicus]